MPIDHSRPSLAGLHDALLGGEDHYDVDRKVLRRVLAIAPEAGTVARENRQWMVRAVRFLSERREIDQFADLGSGLPAKDNTHEVAQKHRPATQVVYVDNDPVVQVHGRSVLASNPHTFFLGNDLTQPKQTFADLSVHLDPERPLGLLLCAILHHVADLDQARGIVRDYVEDLAPGSYVLLSHLHDPDDGSETSEVVRALARMHPGPPFETFPRSREEILSLLDGLEIIDPGLVFPYEWWPPGPRLTPVRSLHRGTLCAVARKP